MRESTFSAEIVLKGKKKTNPITSQTTSGGWEPSRRGKCGSVSLGLLHRLRGWESRAISRTSGLLFSSLYFSLPWIASLTNKRDTSSLQQTLLVQVVSWQLWPGHRTFLSASLKACLLNNFLIPASSPLLPVKAYSPHLRPWKTLSASCRVTLSPEKLSFQVENSIGRRKTEFFLFPTSV